MLYLLPWHGKMNKRNMVQGVGELGPANLLPLLFISPVHSGVLCPPPAPFPVYKRWLPTWSPKEFQMVLTGLGMGDI